MKGFLVVLVSMLISFQSFSQKNYPPEIEGARVRTYKTVDNVDLNLWIFNPSNHKAEDKKPAVIFFFGGGWNGGSPGQFVPHCEYLAARGMVAMVADYRVFSRHEVRANKCVTDAKSSIRWVREHASELGVDPNKIIAGGGSAGGHLAAATATIANFEESGENLSISSKPNALILFNPALILAPVDNPEMGDFNSDRMKKLEIRMGVHPELMSPYHNLNKGMPPTIIFHGTGDTTVPFITAEMFAKKMKEYGNKCILVGYEEEPHGFFNYGRNQNGAFVDSVSKMDKFLVSLGYLEPLPKSKVIR